jgi:excinuclease ABC subunit C
LLQYYGGRPAPKEILTSHEIPEVEAITALLGVNAGHRVKVRTRVRGDRARWLEMAQTNARHAVSLKQQSHATIHQQLEAIAEVLALDDVPERLECFDVSHTGGSSTVASCVVFGTDGSIKSEYRRFNIEGIVPGDDYAALAQALQRRYARVKKGEAPTPDVLVIDGGRGQLKKAMEVIEGLKLDGIQILGVAKGHGRRPGRERLFVPHQDQPLTLAPTSPALHLIQQLRDEAHRFAITAHRGRRQKLMSSSPLEQIPGLGPKRRRQLLRQFGGLQAVARAGVEDLTRVRGISRRLASSIYEHFHAN